MPDLLIRTLLKPGDSVVVETPAMATSIANWRSRGPAAGSAAHLWGPGYSGAGSAVAAPSSQVPVHQQPVSQSHGQQPVPRSGRAFAGVGGLHDFLIIEEDVYGDLQHASCTRLAALPHDDRVIYVASFSKTLSSALRVGYLSASVTLIAQLASLKTLTGIGTSRFAEAVVATLLANGTYRKWVQRLRKRLRTEMAATLQCWRTRSGRCSPCLPGHVPVGATGEADHSRLQARARLGVLLSPGALFSPTCEPVSGCASMWLMRRINGPWRCSGTWAHQIDLDHSENDGRVAFCHYSGANDLCSVACDCQSHFL
jgi:hypothetical protein